MVLQHKLSVDASIRPPCLILPKLTVFRLTLGITFGYNA